MTKARGGKCTEKYYGDIYDLSKKREGRKIYVMKMKMKKTLHEMPPMIPR